MMAFRMRFVRINTLAPEYIRYFYAKRPGLMHAPYCAQFAALMWDSYMQPDSYTHSLSKLGHECLELVGNVKPLQRGWCNENGFQWDAEDFIHGVPLEQIRRFGADTVLATNYNTFPRVWVERLRAYCPSVRHVITWCGVSLETYKPLQCYDTILTCNEHLAREMKQEGLNVHVVPFAFDGRILERIDLNRGQDMEIVFAGLVRRQDGFHADRARLLERIEEQFDLTVFTDCRSRNSLNTFGRQLLFDATRLAAHLGLKPVCQLPGLRNAARWSQRPQLMSEHSMWRKVRPGAYGLDYFQILHDAQICLNVHPNCAGWAASNIRLFEATGVASCLVTDWKENLTHFFEPDYEIVTYRSAEECLDKLKWLHENPSRRSSIGKAGQQRTLREHTYARAAAALDEIIQRGLARTL